MLPENIMPTTTHDQVISPSTHLDVDAIEKHWLKHVVAACFSETQDDQTRQIYPGLLIMLVY